MMSLSSFPTIFKCTALGLILIAIHLPVTRGSAAGQETLIGIIGRDYIMLGADSSSSSSIALTASNLDKILVLSDPFPESKILSSGDDKNDSESIIARRMKRGREQQCIVAAAAGNAADADRLLGLLSAHVSVREYEAGVGCDVECIFNGNNIAAAEEEKEDMMEQEDNVSPLGLDADAIAYLARGEISSSLRSAGHLNVCLLVAGMVRAEVNDDELRGDRAASSSSSLRIQMQTDMAMKEINSKEEVDSSLESGSAHDVTAFLPRDTTNKSQQPPSSSMLSTTTTTLRPRLLWLDEYGSLQTLEYGAHGLGANFCLSILDRNYNPDLSREEAADLIRDCFDQLKTRFVINSPKPPCIKCVDAAGCRIMS